MARVACGRRRRRRHHRRHRRHHRCRCRGAVPRVRLPLRRELRLPPLRRAARPVRGQQRQLRRQRQLRFLARQAGHVVWSRAAAAAAAAAEEHQVHRVRVRVRRGVQLRALQRQAGVRVRSPLPRPVQRRAQCQVVRRRRAAPSPYTIPTSTGPARATPRQRHV